jgi:hypothetical protein
MQMNGKRSDSDIRDAVTQTLAAIHVPRFDLSAIEKRKGRYSSQRSRQATRWLRVLIATPMAIVFIALLVNMPSVRAQVERALRAFAVVNGQTVPLSVRTVSLGEARAHVPFEVIRPAAIPAGLRLTINEVYSESSPADARLIFEYRGSDELPVFTIEESSAHANGPTKLMLTEKRTLGSGAAMDAPPAGGPIALPPPAGASGKDVYVMRNVEVWRENGHTTTRAITIHPIVWVERGTRIILAVADGSLTAQQVAAIRAAMSR